MRIAGFQGALGGTGQVIIRAQASQAQTADAVLHFVSPAGLPVAIRSSSPEGGEWQIGVRSGPELELPTRDGAQLFGPTIIFPEFHFIVDAVLPSEGALSRLSVRVTVERDGRTLWPIDLETGALAIGREAEAPGRAMDIYLRG